MRWWQERVYSGEEYGEIDILRQPPMHRGMSPLVDGACWFWRVVVRTVGE